MNIKNIKALIKDKIGITFIKSEKYGDYTELSSYFSISQDKDSYDHPILITYLIPRTGYNDFKFIFCFPTNCRDKTKLFKILNNINIDTELKAFLVSDDDDKDYLICLAYYSICNNPNDEFALDVALAAMEQFSLEETNNNVIELLEETPIIHN